MSDNPLDLSEITEVIIAAPQDGEWHFVESELSSLFKFVAGNDWHLMVYAPYYKEFWEPILKGLEKENSPVEVKMTCAYEHGNLDEDTLHKLMDSWRTARLTRTKPNMLAVSDRNERDEVTTVHLVITHFDIEPLSEASLDALGLEETEV